MTWVDEEENGGSVNKWPTASTRLNWARNNFQKHSLQKKWQRFLVMRLNLIAMSDLIEEESGEQLVSAKEKKQWLELYETFRPTKAVGRPRNGLAEVSP